MPAKNTSAPIDYSSYLHCNGYHMDKDNDMDIDKGNNE